MSTVLPVQSQQKKKHWKNVSNIFKIYNKDCRTISVCRSVVFENIVFEYMILLLILSR